MRHLNVFLAYTDNFELKFESEKWYINIKKSLDDTVLNKYAELVITLEATENENPNTGYSALVLRLPTAPRFKDAYYVAKYPENDDKTIEFQNAITFLNVDDQKTIDISLDSK